MLGTRAGAARVGVVALSPATAKSNVKLQSQGIVSEPSDHSKCTINTHDNVLLADNIPRPAAIGTGPKSLRLTPAATVDGILLRIGLAGLDVSRDSFSGPLVDASALGPDQETVDSTASLVEAGTVRGIGGVVEPTSGVSVGRGSAGRTHVRGRNGLRGDVGRSASGLVSGMESELVRRVVIHALDDIDLAVVGPMGSHGPHRGPDRAAVRHSGDVEYHQTARVGVLARDSHTVPQFLEAEVRFGVNFHDRNAVLDRDELILGSSGVVNIVDQAVGGISAFEEVEVVKERGSSHRLDELVRVIFAIGGRLVFPSRRGGARGGRGSGGNAARLGLGLGRGLALGI